MEKLGTFIGHHPKSALFITLVIMVLISLGILRMHRVEIYKRCFYPLHSISASSIATLEKHFGKVARRQEVILVPESDNVLNEDCLRDALTIHNVIVNISGFQSICVKNKDRTEYMQCKISTPLEALTYNRNLISNLTEVLVTHWKRLVEFPNSLNKHHEINKIYSKFDIIKKGTNYNISAAAMKLIYYLKQPKTSTEKTLVHDWENVFISQMRTMKRQSSCPYIYYSSAGDYELELKKIFTPQILPLIICVPSILLLAFLILKLFTGSRRTVRVFALAAFSTSMSIFSSISFGFLVGYPYSNTVLIPVAFVAGKVLTEILLIIFEMDQHKDSSLCHQIGGCVSRVGLVLTNTAVFGAILFGFTLLSPFCGINDSYFFALVAILVGYFISTIFTLACLVLSFRQWRPISVRRGVSLPEYKSTLPTNNVGGEKLIPMMEMFGRFLTSVPSKFGVVLITFGIIASCAYTQIIFKGIHFQENTYFSTSLYYRQFETVDLKYFGETDVSIILKDTTDFENVAGQKRILKIFHQLSEKYEHDKKGSNWLASLLDWSKMNAIKCFGSQFYICLQKFLAIPDNKHFRGDITLLKSAQNTTTVGESRIHLYLKYTGKFSSDFERIKSLRDDIMSYNRYILVAASRKFLSLDMLQIQKDFSFKTLIVIGLALLLCSQLFCASIRVGILLVISYVLHIEELITLLILWNVPWNPLSYLCLFIGLIMVLYFNIIIVQLRSLSSERTVEERTVAALRSIGPSIITGISIAIACSVSLGFVFPNFSSIFLGILPVFLALSLFHSLVLLPTIMLLSSKLNEKFANKVALSEYFELNALANPKKQQIWDVDIINQKTGKKLKRRTVSVIGIGCRYPHAQNKEQFWELLTQGQCTVSTYPSNRPEEYDRFQAFYHPKRFVKKRHCTVHGSFLENIRSFDAGFFKISPQEAPAMDPQQRILLQVVYEAIEDAGLRLEDLQQCKTGVFVGAMNLDYSARLMDEDNRVNMDQFYSTGGTASILANRISFCLNLTGPSLTVDTACSSSLTALKIAQECLFSGQCDIAIVCAPNIILDHAVQMTFSIGGLLAPDGRCKSFDASGDGYGRGEGFAAVVLKSTELALADSDDIYCEILACGMNNDGQNAVPITAPSQKTQAELLATVLEEAGVKTADVEYVEAHGTGTAIGDPVETASIAETYCDKTAMKLRALRIGSVKSNVNHTESASGLTGLIKVSLMIKRKMFLPTLGIKVQNPKLKLSEKGIMVQEKCEKWITVDGKLRTAALNSFGYGGSNVHAILREIDYGDPQTPNVGCCTRDIYILTLSAGSEDALRTLARQFANSWLRQQPEEARFKLNLCYSLIERRSQHDHRIAVLFNTFDDASNSLLSFASNDSEGKSTFSSGFANRGNEKLLFVFSGQGSNWGGMAAQMIDREPVFKKAIISINDLIRDLGEKWSLLEELQEIDDKSRITGNIVGQPAAFAVQYATVKLLESWGIFPSAVIGHSLGELVAACIAGALTLEESLKLVLVRSKWQEKCSSKGAMAALGLSQSQAQDLIVDLQLQNSLSVAAVNDHRNVTISGDRDAVQCVEDYLKQSETKVFWKVLSTPRAFHSFYMEVIKKPFQAEAKNLDLHPKSTKIPMYSTVLGDQVNGKQLDSQYWWRNMRESVLFYHAMKNALKDGHKITIEIGPQPVLQHYIHEIANEVVRASKDNILQLLTLPKKTVKHQHRAFLKNIVCTLYTIGYPIHWTNVLGECTRQFVRFPSYPWQEREYWYRNQLPPMAIRSLKSSGPVFVRHPFLSEVKLTEQFSGVQCWETEIDLHKFPTFKDHALIQGGPVLPGSASIEMAIAMATERYQSSSGIEVKDVRFTNLLTLPESQVRLLRLRLECNEMEGSANFSVCNVQDDGTEMPLVKGKVAVNLTSNVSYQACTSEEQDSLTKEYSLDSALKETIMSMTEIPLSKFQRLTELLGYDYGPSYSLIRRIWRNGNKALCMLENDGPFAAELKDYVIHSAFVDACFQTAMALENFDEMDDTTKPTVPVGIKTFSVLDPHIPHRTFCHVTKSSSERFVMYDMRLVDSRGKVYITVEHFQFADVTSLVPTFKINDVTYLSHWTESEILKIETRDMSRCGVIVLKDSKGVASSFTESLKSATSAKIHAVDLPTNTEPSATEECILSALASIDVTQSEVIVVNFWPLEASYLASDCTSITLSQELAFMSSSKAINCLISSQSKFSSDISQRFIMVSRCAQVLDGDERKIIPWGSTAWGMCRTVSLEIPSIRTTAVDLSEVNKNELNLLVTELQVENPDDEIAYRDRKRFVNRLRRMESGSQFPQSETDHNDVKTKEPVTIFLSTHPKSSEICFKKETERSGVLDEDVEVQVTNFWVFSTVSCHIRSKHNEYFGFSGILKTPAKYGNEDENLKTGDLVMGVSNHRRLGNCILVNNKQVVAQPTEMTPQQGATLPSGLVFAFLALKQLSSDVHGAVVIIHEANRELGLLGLMIAQAMGFSVVCTSSDPRLESSKRYLKSLGAAEVTDAQFTDLERHTQNIADAALFFYHPIGNSVKKSCEILKPDGKIIVLGQNSVGDISIPSNASVTYHGMSYSNILDSPERFQNLWTSSLALLKSTKMFESVLKITQKEISVLDLLNNRQVNPERVCERVSLFKENTSESHPPDHEEFEASLCSFSFRPAKDLFQNTDLLPAGLDQYGLKRDRTYMVVGGVRGFGFEVARWMAHKGAGTIVLVARSPPSQTKVEEVAALENETGAKVKILQADVSSYEQMRFVQTNVLSKLPNLAGIVLTAMVLHDQLITQLERETFYKVIAPKVTGAFLLHQMSRKMDLDFFVMFSSIASLLGNPGQASYSAANAFLDSLAQYRRKVLHLPALSINWGPIEGAGVLQRQENTAKLLVRTGYKMIDARKGIELMEQLLIDEPLTCQVGVFDADWPRMLESSPGLKKTTRLLDIKDEVETTKKEKSLESLGPRILMEVDKKKREDLVMEFLTELLSSWLGISATEIDLNTSLYNYGLDSFFALTFKMQLESTLEVSFEVFYFMQPDTTPAKIVQDTVASLSKQNKESINDVLPTSTDTVSKSEKVVVEEPHTESYPKDESCPTATYQIIPLYKPDQARVNFFCIHPAGRYVMNLVPISTGFANQNLIAFFAIGYTDPTMTGDTRSVRQLAKSYVSMIKQVQKHGPYFIGGQSFGGLVAYEMASILVEEKEDVAFVSMIDTFPWEMKNRSGAARLEYMFGGKKLDWVMEELFQETFEQVLGKLASQILKLTSEEYAKTRENMTQEETITFLQNRAQQLGIALYDIKELKQSLEQDNYLATHKHREWKPAAIYYNGPLTFLMSADQRFTPIKPLQESSDEAWSLLVDGNIDVYICPGDHLALGEVNDAMVTGRILAVAIGMRYRTLLGRLPRLQRNYKEKKAIQKFRLGVEVFLHSRKGFKPPKYGKVFLHEEQEKLVFKPMLDDKTHSRKISASPKKEKNSSKVFNVIDVQMVLPAKHVAVSVKRKFQQKEIHGHQSGNYAFIAAMVMPQHHVRNFEFLESADFRDFFTLFQALFGVVFNLY